MHVTCVIWNYTCNIRAYCRTSNYGRTNKSKTYVSRLLGRELRSYASARKTKAPCSMAPHLHTRWCRQFVINSAWTLISKSAVCSISWFLATWPEGHCIENEKLYLTPWNETCWGMEYWWPLLRSLCTSWFYVFGNIKAALKLWKLGTLYFSTG